MRIEHIALYVRDLEAMRSFFIRYFDAESNALYHNSRTGFSSYFLSFSDGSRLELMYAPDMQDPEKGVKWTGYVHLAFSAGSRERVDELTRVLAEAGFPVLSGPRITGDGYYESCILGPENNQIEITI